MKIRRVINRPIDIRSSVGNVSGGVNAVVSVNVNEKGEGNHVVQRQSVHVTQTGETNKTEEETHER